MTTSDFQKPLAVQLSGSALARWLLARIGWCSGFYQTSFKAQVSLGLVRLDDVRREIVVPDFIQVVGNPAVDVTRITSVSGMFKATALKMRHPSSCWMPRCPVPIPL